MRRRETLCHVKCSESISVKREALAIRGLQRLTCLGLQLRERKKKKKKKNFTHAPSFISLFRPAFGILTLYCTLMSEWWHGTAVKAGVMGGRAVGW